MSFSRPWFGRLLLHPTAWHRMVHRLLRRLRDGGEAGLILAGGVPSTTRALYGVREWLAGLRRASPYARRPSAILEKLRADSSFVEFERVGPCGPALSRSAWRMAEAWAMSTLAGVFGADEGGGPTTAESGTLSRAARASLGRCLDAFGLPPGEADAALRALETELARETPHRARFFRLLAGRVLRRGRPIVLLPIAHRAEGAGVISYGEAWAWTCLENGVISARRAGSDAPWRGSADDFAREFVGRNFA